MKIAHAKVAKDAKFRRGPRLRSGQVGVDVRQGGKMVLE